MSAMKELYEKAAEEAENAGKGELSEEELDAVAGGMITPYESSVVNPSQCDAAI